MCISFIVFWCSFHHFINITLLIKSSFFHRYEDDELQDVAVTCAKCPHALYAKCPLKSAADHCEANFCVKANVPICYDQVAGHPRAALSLDSMNEVNFFVAFKCLNSCPELTQHGRNNRIVNLELVDFEG